jgi:transcription antitermination protein NusB
MNAPGKRRKSRELAMQMLFQLDMGKNTPDEVRNTFWKAREEDDADVRGFAEDIFRVAVARAPEVTDLIVKHSAHWKLERMASVDRNVLRMAIAEMLGFPGTRPWKSPGATRARSPSTSSTEFSTPWLKPVSTGSLP